MYFSFCKVKRGQGCLRALKKWDDPFRQSKKSNYSLKDIVEGFWWKKTGGLVIIF